jgi:hypothetical protein
MRRSSLLGTAAILGLLSAPGGTRATTLVQTQLIGIRGATVLTFVSQYLPPDLNSLAPRLKRTAEQMLQSSGLKSTGGANQYLTIDVSGERVSSDRCGDAFSVHVVVEFIEPVRLTRAPEQRLPNNNTVATWREAADFIVSESELEPTVTSQVHEAVQLFIDTVLSVNRPEGSKN